MNKTTYSLLAAVLACGFARQAVAQTTHPADLSTATIEDLMNVEITSASRKQQRAEDVAAAVFVITSDDIRRSGMTTIPDVLRLAPGVEVAQINSNKWAVSVRGFNGVFADKLLVLIDGRSVYNRIFSGVLWDAEDLMLDDVDRIEVIRGPGAALWGANAVNGVINIVTKSTADTEGALVRIDGGRADEQAAIRYGGALGAATYRVYSQWTEREPSVIAPGTNANDASHSVTMGFRADWSARPGAFTLEGDFTAGQERALWPNLNPQTAAGDPIANVASDSRGGHLLARWTHTQASGASLQVQSFLDIEGRQEPVGDYHHQAADVDVQYHTALGRHQDVVAGAGFRYVDEGFAGHVGFSLTPAEDRSSLATAFVQDEIMFFGSRVAVTLGSQVQYDSAAGSGLQPTARVMWKAHPRQRVWASTSRALRTPSLYERGLDVQFPPVASANGLPLVLNTLGNPSARTEGLVDQEVGYRLEMGTKASIDITGYMGHYDQLQTQEVGTPVAQFVPSPQILVTTEFGNLLDATTRGLEIAGSWTPVSAWRLDGSYTAFHVTPHLAAASQDPIAAGTDGSVPQTQWQLRSAFSLGARSTLALSIFRAGPIAALQVNVYTRADLNVEWRITSHLSAMAIGQNLLHAAHTEFAGPSSLLLATEVPQSASLRLRWSFR